MKCKNSSIKKSLFAKNVVQRTAFFLFCLYSICGYGQSGEGKVDALAEMGFENVGWTESEGERVYVLQKSAYRLQGVGIGKAVDVIQKIGMPENKPCRIIVLDNNVPQISLYYEPVVGDTVAVAERRDWKVSYDLDDSWKLARKIKTKNSSLFKVDIVVYPDFMFQNYKLPLLFGHIKLLHMNLLKKLIYYQSLEMLLLKLIVI